MINWRPEYVALLSRYYRENILKVGTTEGYLEANRMIGRAAHVRPLTVERWITGERRPNRVQGERLVRWAATVGWWECKPGRYVSTTPRENWVEDRWVRLTIAEKLSELIRESKKDAGKGE